MFLFNPPIALGSVIQSRDFSLVAPPEPAVLQVYSDFTLMSLNPCISFKLPTSVLNETRLGFPLPTHGEV